MEHGNALLQLENSVIGERLKALYAYLPQITLNKAGGDAYRADLQFLVTSAQELTTYIGKLEAKIAFLVEKNEELTEWNRELVKYREGDKIEMMKIAAIARDKLMNLQGELKKISEIKENATISLEKQEKKLKEAMDENEKLRQKVNKSRVKRKYTEMTEKLCRTCQRLYLESENFNWSCRTHYGEYSGEMWWCCGKAGREALGCRLARHVCKEEEEETAGNAETVMLTSVCSSCKSLGHLHSNCPKDPNIRSQQDLTAELDRLHSIHRRKKQAQVTLNWRTTALSLHTKQFHASMYADNDSGSSEAQESGSERDVTGNRLKT